MWNTLPTSPVAIGAAASVIVTSAWSVSSSVRAAIATTPPLVDDVTAFSATATSASVSASPSTAHFSSPEAAPSTSSTVTPRRSASPRTRSTTDASSVRADTGWRAASVGPA
ncbi:MAG: hypothetical protein LC659_03185 [Myxococcales bacterium]|nr:hypothetical protein [Myxococcales bacterium]